MPSYSTHCIFARELIPFLYSNCDFELNEEAVMLGTQGPDIFFFHRVFPWMLGKSSRKIGSMLHRARPAEILESMRKYCKLSTKKDIAKSYVCGFIFHYALDRRCHPYVYYFQNKIVKEKPLTNPHTAHNIVEFSMDSYMLNNHYGISNPVLFDTACTISDSVDVLVEIGKLYTFVVKEVLGKDIPESIGKIAIMDTKRVQNATHDATGVKKVIISALETLIAPFSKNYKFSSFMRPRDLEKAKKYANIDNNRWESPFDGSIHTESFEDLFELAKIEAKAMIIAFQNGDDTKDITKNLSFLTGVEVE